MLAAQEVTKLADRPLNPLFETANHDRFSELGYHIFRTVSSLKVGLCIRKEPHRGLPQIDTLICRRVHAIAYRNDERGLSECVVN